MRGIEKIKLTILQPKIGFNFKQKLLYSLANALESVIGDIRIYRDRTVWMWNVLTGRQGKWKPLLKENVEDY